MTVTDFLVNIAYIVVTGLVAMGAIPAAMHLLQRLDAKLPINERTALEGIVWNVVQAVEQRFNRAPPSPTINAQKKTIAIQDSLALAKDAGLPPPNQIALDTLIEKAVLALPYTYDTKPAPAPASLFGKNASQPTGPVPVTNPLRPITAPINTVNGAVTPVNSAL